MYYKKSYVCVSIIFTFNLNTEKLVYTLLSLWSAL
jgi:hypothetical protein